jgi:hypothetical protein
MKWVINYNADFMQHLILFLNGEKIWIHWGAIC